MVLDFQNSPLKIGLIHQIEMLKICNLKLVYMLSTLGLPNRFDETFLFKHHTRQLVCIAATGQKLKPCCRLFKCDVTAVYTLLILIPQTRR